MKAGFLSADKLLTVSPNYAEEIQQNESKGVELDSVIRLALVTTPHYTNAGWHASRQCMTDLMVHSRHVLACAMLCIPVVSACHLHASCL